MDKQKLKDNYKKVQESSKKVSSFLAQKKIQNIIIIILLLGLIVLGTCIRVQNLPLLVDQTTGEYIPLALDPYYFLRVAETMVETGGEMPLTDQMRYPSLGIDWHQEILPELIASSRSAYLTLP